MPNWKSRYIPPSKELWEGRVDSTRPERIHQMIECHEISDILEQKYTGLAFAILGFRSDEGVKRNKGRAGAYEGPTALRKSLGCLPLQRTDDYKLLDVGDISCDDGDLEDAQKQLGETVAAIHEMGALPILLGGGHEISWGHYLGINQALPNTEIAVINFDAHYDLRPLSDQNLGSSGTPFRQIADSRKQGNLPFSYFCFGIQKSGNTSALCETAGALGVKTIFAEQFHLGKQGAARELIEEVIASHRFIYLTICMDVFASPYAPGVSAPQPLGLTPWHVIPLLREVAQCGKVVGIDFAELSPRLDHNSRTAQLAASLVAEFIAHFQK